MSVEEELEKSVRNFIYEKYGSLTIKKSIQIKRFCMDQGDTAKVFEDKGVCESPNFRSDFWDCIYRGIH
jgi:hypothetical protein